jgi:hypothetical protein
VAALKFLFTVRRDSPCVISTIPWNLKKVNLLTTGNKQGVEALKLDEKSETPSNTSQSIVLSFLRCL